MESGGVADLSDLTLLRALGHPVRRRLYEHVAATGQAIRRDEAAAAVGVSRSLAAYHLDKLTEQGLLETSFARRGGRAGPGAGRPAKLYRRARREYEVRTPPRDYRLLGELLVRAAEEDRTGAVRATLERVSYTYGRAVGRRARHDGGAGRTELEDLLRLRGYEPFEDENGTLRLRNCPFESVATECPEVVCGLNLRLIEGLIEGLGIHGGAVLEPRPHRCCVAITT